VASELPVGETRFGDLIDGNEATPQIRVQIRRTDATHVELIVPWASDSSEEPYRRWFSGNTISFDDDPDRSLYRYSVPPVLLFQDHHGPVVLVGCSSVGYTESWMLGSGAGRARVRHAVFGGRSLEYAKVNGMRTEVSGLHSWLDIHSISEDRPDHSSGVYTVRAAAPVEIDGIEGLSFVPVDSVRPGGEGERILRESVHVQTLRAEPVRWAEHWKMHLAIRDLVATASWRPERFTAATVSRDDDPLRVASGDAVGRAWHDVVAAGVDASGDTPPRRHADFLFRSRDLPEGAIAQWIRLREQYARAVDPIISGLRLDQGAVESAFAQVGIGMEALGYQLALRTGTPAKADKRTFAQRLELVAADLPLVMPFDVETWVRETTAAYNGIKHANRALPAAVQVLNRTRECQLMFRAWIAYKLGMDLPGLQRAVDADPMVHAYEALPDPADDSVPHAEPRTTAPTLLQRESRREEPE